LEFGILSLSPGIGISIKKSISYLYETALGMGVVSFCVTLHFWRSLAKTSFAKDLADSPVRGGGDAQIIIFQYAQINFDHV